MHRFKILLAGLLFGLVLSPGVSAQEGGDDGEDSVVELAPPPPPCGTQPITVARLQWPSAEILAEIHARVLAIGLDCETRVVPGDLGASGSSMGTTGQPAVVPEMWITRIADIWNQAIKSQKVRQAGSSYDDPVLEGWFIPDYVAAAHPELTSVAALAANAPVFARDGAPGRFISCPLDWGCSVVNRNLIRAFGLLAAFEIVEPANRFELDTLIAEAVSRREPIVFYYWQPNAVLAQFSFQRLQLGAYDSEAFACLGQRICGSPVPSDFAPDPVVIALAEWVFLEAPQVAAYFQRARMPVAEMNRLLAALSEPGATVETVAESFVIERGEVWRPWVGLSVIAGDTQETDQ